MQVLDTELYFVRCSRAIKLKFKISTKRTRNYIDRINSLIVRGLFAKSLAAERASCQDSLSEIASRQPNTFGSVNESRP